MNRWFASVATNVGIWTGHPLAFILSLSACVVWAISGPFFGYSDTWQLVINTATTVLTFLLVFVIQNTQNRSDRAVHLKLDELVVKMDATSNRLAGVEKKTDDELDALEQEVLSQAEGHR